MNGINSEWSMVNVTRDMPCPREKVYFVGQ